MDSREPPPSQPQQSSAPPILHPHHQQQQQHHHHHHHHHQQQQQNMISAYPASMINHNNTNNNPSATIPNPNSSSSGFPFHSVGPHAPQLQQQQQQPRPPSKPPADEGGGGGVFDGSSPPSSGMGFCIEPGKKKRGRPRKYTPEGNIALGLSTAGISSSGGAASVGYSECGGGGGTPGGSSEPAPKRNRGRPPGSVKKQLDALGGVGGVGFTPHVIMVKAGEDVASQIMAFSQQGPRTVCILSANGAVRNVTLHQPSMSGATVSYEGRFEIISLSGSYLFSENNGGRNNRSGGLSVSLAGADGRVLGGGVAGVLVAASPVQVIVGSFVADGKKSRSGLSKSGSVSTSGPQMLNFDAPLTASSPPSQGASSESSDDNGSGPLNRGPGLYGNSGQQMHSMPMYQLWTGQNPQ